jgi:hypothetical protein
MTDDERRAKPRIYEDRYRKKHQALINERSRARYAANPQPKREANRQWRELNPERQAAMSKEWAMNHPERTREYGRRFYQEHRDRFHHRQLLITAAIAFLREIQILPAGTYRQNRALVLAAVREAGLLAELRL